MENATNTLDKTDKTLTLDKRKATRTRTGRPIVPLRGLTSAPLRGEAPPPNISTRERERDRERELEREKEREREREKRRSSVTSSSTARVRSNSVAHRPTTNAITGTMSTAQPPSTTPVDKHEAERERKAKHARLSLAREPPSYEFGHAHSNSYLSSHSNSNMSMSMGAFGNDSLGYGSASKKHALQPRSPLAMMPDPLSPEPVLGARHVPPGAKKGRGLLVRVDGLAGRPLR